jgi:L-aminopeptidase/D-esterase-like protein
MSTACLLSRPRRPWAVGLAACACVLALADGVGAQASSRARSLGIPLEGVPGPINAITDVPGVEVGATTIIRGEGREAVRTGVTAILPRGRRYDPVFAGWYALNGNGEMTGTTWVTESGFLETPVLLTNTFSVGVVRDGALEWMQRHRYFDPFAPSIGDYWFTYPVVAETYDGILNDITGHHVRKEDAIAALDTARTGPVAEGPVGGGTGMVCHGFKCGNGTASRRVRAGGADYTLGVFVQANYGRRASLTIAGVPVGRHLTDLLPAVRPLAPPKEVGSIIVVVATDAPLLPHQLQRLARRVPLGIGRVGGQGGNSSGDIFIAFSTANAGAARREGTQSLKMLANDAIDPLFEATIQATEEAILNALVAGRDMTGFNGNVIHGIPHQRIRELLGTYNRLAK